MDLAGALRALIRCQIQRARLRLTAGHLSGERGRDTAPVSPPPAMRPPTPLLPPPDDEVIRAIDATRRGMRLLLQNLNETQRDQFRWSNFFEVIGGTTGRRYRVRLGLVQNVEELDQTGKRICGWCFAPFGNLVEGD